MSPIAIGARLPLKTRQLIIILLSILITAVIGAVVAYGIGSLINRYREHKHKKALVEKKAMDIEAQIIAAEKRSMHRTLSQINLSDVPLVPSFPPIVYVGPREKQRIRAQVQARNVPVQVSHRVHVPAPVARFCSDSEIITSVPVPPIVGPTASHHYLIRSPTTISMCDRYPVFIPSSTSSPSGPGTVASCPGKPLLATTTEGRAVMRVGVQEQQQPRDASTTVTALIISTSAAERIGLYMMQTEEDDSGNVTNTTSGEDEDADTDTSESLLAYYHLP